jgi:hypothetical protein
MKMSLDAVAAIARAAASEHASRLRVLGVASIRGATTRVELLVRVTDHGRPPRLVMLNVSRTEPSQLEREIRLKLREALATRFPRS